MTSFYFVGFKILPDQLDQGLNIGLDQIDPTATAREVQAISEFAYESCEEEMVGLDDTYYDVCVCEC